jgi:twinkle protein
MNLDISFEGRTSRVVCPFCADQRRKSNLKEMTLTRKDDGAVVYYCHHCDANGSVQNKATYQEKKLAAVPALVPPSKGLGEKEYTWLEGRGISRATADKMKLFPETKYFKRLERNADAIGFPYFRNGVFMGTKYRSFPDKDFTQDAGGNHDFFGLDQVELGKPIVIVEGEIDCLTAMEAGIENVVSVPSGAPVKVADGKVSPTEDKKFAYVWNAREVLDAAPYVIIATDQDPPGQALAEELARRIGKEKCRVAKFDKKDLNEVFNDPTRHDPSRDAGSEAVRAVVDGATPYPISGLSDADTYFERLNDLFEKGTGKGFSTGYASVDSIYTVAPGQLTVVTGYPSSGKSNFVDQLMVNLASKEDWKFAVCSFENQPEIHIARLMEIYTKRKFFDGQNRMAKDVMEVAFKWVKDHFLFIDSNGEEPSTLDSILERARVAVKRMGIRGLVIDPYNYIDLDRKDSTETEAISNMLTRVQKFCKAQDVHTWFVAHPSKIQRSGVEQPRPDGMSISGSMAWWAKTDCGLTVHRGEGPTVEIAVWKCRYRWVGTQGETSLVYSKESGSYYENLDKF